jgi:hypothetical protein
MTTSDPTAPRSASWQLPWLRVSLILRKMSQNAACGDEDLAELLKMRRTLAQRGWFN